MDLTIVRSQHYQLRTTIEELKDIFKENDLENNLLIVSLKIGILSGILRMHLTYEDHYVYPKLFEHQDEEVKETANKYKETMGDLSIRFGQYLDQYIRQPNAILNEGFIADTKQILADILTRIEHEEYGLFPLVK